jgi:hypothetical protein
MSPKSIVHVRVRMPVAFHRKLLREAKHHGQTLNAEILRRLEESWGEDDSFELVSAALARVHDDLSRKNEEVKKLIIDRVGAAYKSDTLPKGMGREFSDRVVRDVVKAFQDRTEENEAQQRSEKTTQRHEARRGQGQ